MYKLKDGCFYKGAKLTNQTDSALLKDFSKIILEGYEISVDQVCCIEQALVYLYNYFDEIPNYIIIPKNVILINNEKNFIEPIPVYWNGKADDIIKEINRIGFDVYHSGEKDKCIFIFPQPFRWDRPGKNII